jgi:hypothetical protein
MLQLKAYTAVLALLLSATLLSGSLVHAVVPDHHGHTHGEPLVQIWQDLHAALAHVDKKALAILEGMLGLHTLFFLSVAVLYVARRGKEWHLLDPVLGETLRRGINPHRAFR